MSTNRTNRTTLPQRYLYGVGERHLGEDRASRMTEVSVRLEGLKHLSIRAALIGAALVGSLTFIDRQFDASPSVNRIENSHNNPPTTTANLGHPVYDPSEVQSELPSK